jgi:hypothetical protein
MPPIARAAAAAAAIAAALLAVGTAGCASGGSLHERFVEVDGARIGSGGDTSRVTLVSLDARRPVLLRGVDGQLLSSIGQVPSALQAWTYVLHPGPHTLWVSSVPAGLPFVPQRLSCWIVGATLHAGERYLLQWNDQYDAPILARGGAEGTVVVGRLVDQPLVIERACRWQ